MSAPFECWITKNSREELKVSLTEFHGHDLINLRVFFKLDDGELRPGKAGLALRVEKLDDLIEALQRAQRHRNGGEGA